jgi:hypothetical protein
LLHQHLHVISLFLQDDVVEILAISELPEKYNNSNLLLYMPFNDTTSNESDYLLDAQVVSGVTSESTSFNNINDSTYIAIDDNDLFDFTSEFSLCIWFKNDKESPLGQGLLGKPKTNGASGYGLQLHYTGSNIPLLLFGMHDNYGNAINCNYYSNDLIVGWHFVVASYDGDTARLYVDGELKVEEIQKIILSDSERSFYIARECDSVDDPPYDKRTRYFYGSLDNVMVFDRALTLEEISELYGLRVTEQILEEI